MSRMLAGAWLTCMGVLSPLLAQGFTGDLRLTVVDPGGAPIRATLSIISQGQHVDRELSTADAGQADLKPLPFGVYQVVARSGDLLVRSEIVEVRSALPQSLKLRLAITPQTTAIEVNAASTLIDPSRTSSTMQIGSRQIADRLSSLPGRSIQELIVAQPGWLHEGNAVLHPRGSEYQTQFVVDGVPLTDDRSPASAPKSKPTILPPLTSTTPASRGVRPQAGRCRRTRHPQNHLARAARPA